MFHEWLEKKPRKQNNTSPPKKKTQQAIYGSSHFNRPVFLFFFRSFSLFFSPVLHPVCRWDFSDVLSRAFVRKAERGLGRFPPQLLLATEKHRRDRRSLGAIALEAWWNGARNHQMLGETCGGGWYVVFPQGLGGLHFLLGVDIHISVSPTRTCGGKNFRL